MKQAILGITGDGLLYLFGFVNGVLSVSAKLERCKTGVFLKALAKIAQAEGRI